MRSLSLFTVLLVLPAAALVAGCAATALAVTPAAMPSIPVATIPGSTITPAPTSSPAPSDTSSPTFTGIPTSVPTAASTLAPTPVDTAVPTQAPLVPLNTATAPIFPSGPLVISLADSGRVFPLNVGDEFELALGPGAVWNPTPADLAVVRPVAGAPGIYQTIGPGNVVIQITIEPPCRSSHPPCMLPSRLFVVTITVG